MSWFPFPLNGTKTAVFVDQIKAIFIDSTTPVNVKVDDSIPVEVNVQQPVSIDDNGNSITVDGTVAVSNFPSVQPVSDNSESLTIDSDDGSISTYHKPDYSQLSTAGDPAPAAGNEGVTMEYTDTGDRFRWTGVYWVKTHLDGGVLVRATGEFLIDIAKGLVPGHSIIHKFGHSDVVGTTLVPVCSGEVYQTLTAAETLELVSTAATDNQAGVGARTITIQGLDANFEEQSVTANMHATDGTIAETVTGYAWSRVFRMYVEGSGAYANSVAGSHAGTVTLRTSGGAGVDWALLEIHAGFPLSQSQIGAYTVPKGKKAYIGSITVETDSAKAVDVFGFRRNNANDIVAPYPAMRTFAVFTGITDSHDLRPKSWMNGLDEYTDIGFLAIRSSAGTSSVSVDFEIILVDK